MTIDELRELLALQRELPRTISALIAALVADGWSQTEIARAVGLTKQEISRRVAQHRRFCAENPDPSELEPVG